MKTIRTIHASLRSVSYSIEIGERHKNHIHETSSSIFCNINFPCLAFNTAVTHLLARLQRNEIKTIWKSTTKYLNILQHVDINKMWGTAVWWAYSSCMISMIPNDLGSKPRESKKEAILTFLPTLMFDLRTVLRDVDIHSRQLWLKIFGCN